MLQTLELHADDRLAVMKLRQADFDAAGATRDMTEDLVNEAGRIGCTEATIMFTEEPDGSVRVNLRSKQSLDVSALAQRFNGGGHARASGARPDGPWDEVVQRVIAAAVKALDE
jgi:phosphoesterase RecJ-like protein